MTSTTMNDDLVTTLAAAEYLGVSSAQFTRLMTKLGVVHDGEYPNPYYLSGPKTKLWRGETLTRIKLREEFKAFAEGAAARSAKAREGAVTKTRTLRAECMSWVPIVQRIPIDVAQSRAIDAYNDFTDSGPGGAP